VTAASVVIVSSTRLLFRSCPDSDSSTSGEKGAPNEALASGTESAGRGRAHLYGHSDFAVSIAVDRSFEAGGRLRRASRYDPPAHRHNDPDHIHSLLADRLEQRLGRTAAGRSVGAAIRSLPRSTRRRFMPR